MSAYVINSNGKLSTVCIKDRHDNITSTLMQHLDIWACQLKNGNQNVVSVHLLVFWRLVTISSWSPKTRRDEH